MQATEGWYVVRNFDEDLYTWHVAGYSCALQVILFTWCILSGERLRLGNPNIEKMKGFICERIRDRGKFLASVLQV